MGDEKAKGIIEAILFSTGRCVKFGELINILELSSDTINRLISEMQIEYENENRGIQIVRVEDGFTLASKTEYHEYLYPALDKRIKPTLSQASLEVLAIIAYNQRITRADIDNIRGVDSSASIYRLTEYNLIEQAGKADLPGKPMTYRTTEDFLKMFGLKSLKELPKLPKYKLDSNRQIVIDDIEDLFEEEATTENDNNISSGANAEKDNNINNEAISDENKNDIKYEAPMPKND